jgi:glycosyltransferase involved in cell wall biosynthesis
MPEDLYPPNVVVRHSAQSVCLISFSDFGLGRGEYLAEAMKAIGLEVLVVTNKPIYTESFKTIKNTLSKNKIDVLEIPLPNLPYESVFSRLIQYLLFTIFSFFILLKSRRSFTFYYSRGPHPFTDATCIMLKLFKGGKIISDITDLWPEVLDYMQINVFLKRILILFGNVVNSFTWSKLDAIVTHNEIMAHILSRRSGRRVYVIYGVIDLNIFKPISKWNAIQKLPRDLQGKLYRKFIVLYAGIMGYFQDPEIVLKLAQLITDKDILFVLIGTGPLKEQLAKEREKQNLDNILLLDPVPHELMPFIYNVADLTLLPPPVSYDSRMYKYFVVTLPKKFIEYSACGKPIICITPECVASKLCKKWKAGYHFLPEKLEDIVYIIQELKSNETLRRSLGDNAMKMASSLFSIENTIEKLRAILT